MTTGGHLDASLVNTGQDVVLAVAAFLQVRCTVECPRVCVLLLAFEVVSTVVAFILHGQKVVGGAALVLLAGSVLLNFGLQPVGCLPVLHGHEVVSLSVTTVAFLSGLGVHVLLLFPLLLAEALVSHRVVLIEPVRLCTDIR